MKHLLFFLTLVIAVPAMATEENDTTIYYNNKQIVVSTDSIATHVAVFNKDGSALVKSQDQRNKLYRWSGGGTLLYFFTVRAYPKEK